MDDLKHKACKGKSYLLTNRPPGPATYPDPENCQINIIEWEGRKVWELNYAGPLTFGQVNRFELKPTTWEEGVGQKLIWKGKYIGHISKQGKTWVEITFDKRPDKPMTFSFKEYLEMIEKTKILEIFFQ